MGAIKVCIVLVCLAAAGSGWGFGRSTLKEETGYERVVRIARKEISVREISENSSPRIREYLSCVGIKEAAPWCASFVSWCHKEAGFAQPRTPWSPSLFPKARVVKEPLPGCVFGIYFNALGRVAHCGVVVKLHGGNVYTVEGNTSVAGSREGDGVYARVRHRRTIYCYADWIGRI
ncbi:uncharacterized protein (TIGR02594 family) [Pedobacter africanus]|uniref:Uncharacterized protein (TIGR02594 family) n=1 Tax=Pedobacter africanus TaxID=151894 RepID=A0ACC6KZI8_9SPHI|nr:CHAP domain-containing protein [Pedobacter africanus]MDR6784595.1 uncharacterized protein (TIGR02594 family) [Pedobacter africanus]